eukprot:CAMPEP_0168797974 /NCGR_PEP_ID=MMETSP0725-20121227/17629_1 /TAXON_ID=265536 /ORGANISM="Amphiprora sp., Strain CCMP467" /LENGTH=129 /DNA_ID=CAMNT_0008849301 /DNA_START=75 /DNA_END=464 /DNA_ORIENTATION=-
MESKPNHLPLEGDYKLIKMEDKNGEQIPLPSDFSMHILHDEKMALNQYRIALKIGNTLGGMLTLDAPDDTSKKMPAKIGPLMSTMMMPPPEIFHVEQCASKIVPSMQELSYSGSELIFHGTEGTLRFER